MIRNLAVIPARAGSKGLKGKNTILLGNKPLVNWTIDSALATEFFDKIILSTDIPSIESICKSYKDSRFHIFRRPSYLCRDETPLGIVISQALDTAELRFLVRFTNIFTLQPTSPFRNSKDIIRAYSIYRKERVDSLLSVCEERHSLWKVKNDEVTPIFKPSKNRQWLEPYYIGNGAIFITKRKILKFNKDRLGNKVGLYVMDKISSIDIHTQEDLELAEWYLKRQ